jgi:hypothetical protein
MIRTKGEAGTGMETFRNLLKFYSKPKRRSTSESPTSGDSVHRTTDSESGPQCFYSNPLIEASKQMFRHLRTMTMEAKLTCMHQYKQPQSTFPLHRIAFRSDVKKVPSIYPYHLGTLFSEELLQRRDVVSLSFWSLFSACTFRIRDRCFVVPLRKAIRYSVNHVALKVRTVVYEQPACLKPTLDCLKFRLKQSLHKRQFV